MAISRRKFLIGSGFVGGGLALGLYLSRDKPPIPGTVEGSFQPNAWLQISADGRVIFHLHKAEMGQGVITALPLILGEELDFDPAGFEMAMAGVHADYIAGPVGVQITGGSNSVASSWDSLRHAGAAARAMLVAAAAKHWGVAVAECATDNGEVINKRSSERLAYKDLAEAAKGFADTDYQLKAATTYRWIGTDYPRLDAVGKATGTAQFGVDVVLDGMKVAVIARCPHFGGKLKNWSPLSVNTLPGVVTAFEVHSGIAIVADTYWQARSAANQLQVTWDKGPLAGLDSAAIDNGMAATLAKGEPRIAFEKGDIAKANLAPEQTLAARYSVPFTHHSPMEPQNATALYTQSQDGNRCEVWSPSQTPDISRALAAHFGELDHDRITVHSTLMGGGFGRRGYPDFVGEVVAVARQLPGVPVKLMWSREDDMRHDYYRPGSLHDIEASLDDNGSLATWRHTLVAPSILGGLGVYMMSTMLPTWVPTAVARSLGGKIGAGLTGFDPSRPDGAEIPYAVEHLSVGHLDYDPGVPIGFWRSVSQSFNVFVVEAFMDEMAYKASVDPLEFRLRHLADAPRHRRVLELAAEKADWGKTSANLGIALSRPFDTYCAMVVEVVVTGSSFTVKRVVAAVDCGYVIAPDIAKSQIEGGIIYGLSAALKAPVTFADGATAQSNFHDLPVLRMDEAPDIEVYLVASNEAPTGVGEIGVPAIAPAVANALFAATGQRLRDLPLRLS